MTMSDYQLKIEHGVDMCYVTIYEDNVWIDQYAGLLEREGELVEKAKQHVEWLKVKWFFSSYKTQCNASLQL